MELDSLGDLSKAVCISAQGLDRSRKNEIKGNKFLGDAYVVLCLFTGSHERCR